VYDVLLGLVWLKLSLGEGGDVESMCLSVCEINGEERCDLQVCWLYIEFIIYSYYSKAAEVTH